MKKNKILLALLTSACVGMTAGCGEAKYNVKTESNDAEYGSITGGGSYTNGQNVSVKIYPNDGCYLPETGAALSFVASDEAFNRDITLSELTEIRDDNGNISYYEYPFKIQLGSVEGGEMRTYGTYKAQFSCRTNTTADVATSVAAERTVEFKVLDGEGNEMVDVIVPSQTVKFNAKIKETSYIDGIEGKIVWYRDAEFTTKYNFNDGVTDNFTLYGKVENATPKDIVADAIKNFEGSKLIEMTINNDLIQIQNYTKDPTKYKDMDIMVYEKSAGNVLKFMINDDSYYEISSVTGGDYYKLPFSGTGFDAFDIAKVNMFFKHMDVNVENDTTFTFEKAKGEGDVHITETIDEQVCYKYLVKDSEGNLYMEFFIRNGYVYKTVDASGKVNLIKYPTGELGALDPENIRDLFLINLSSNNATLNAALSEINTSWEKVLMVRPAKGETIETLLTTNTNVKDLLRKYDYVVKDADGYEINTNTYFINGNKNLTIFVNGEYAPVEAALEALKVGGFGIKTEVTVFDDETVSKEYNVEAATNVFELAEKPGTMHRVIWDALQTLKGMPTAYYEFDYDSVTGVYSFYKKKDDNVPFITIKLNEGKISNMNYYEIDTDGDVTTYVSTFTYSA